MNSTFSVVDQSTSGLLATCKAGGRLGSGVAQIQFRPNSVGAGYKWGEGWGREGWKPTTSFIALPPPASLSIYKRCKLCNFPFLWIPSTRLQIFSPPAHRPNIFRWGLQVDDLHDGGCPDGGRWGRFVRFVKNDYVWSWSIGLCLVSDQYRGKWTLAVLVSGCEDIEENESWRQGCHIKRAAFRLNGEKIPEEETTLDKPSGNRE